MGTSRRLVPLCKQNAAHLHYPSFGGGGVERTKKIRVSLTGSMKRLKGCLFVIQQTEYHSLCHKG